MSDYCFICWKELDEIWCGHFFHGRCKEHCKGENDKDEGYGDLKMTIINQRG